MQDNTTKLIDAWADGIGAFQLALGHIRAGRPATAAIATANRRLERAHSAVLALEVDEPFWRLQGDLLESLEMAGAVLLLHSHGAAPAALAAAQADLDEQLRIIDAEAIRQGLAPPVD